MYVPCGGQPLHKKTCSEAFLGNLCAAGERGAGDVAKSPLSGNTDKTLLLKLPKIVSLRGFLTKDKNQPDARKALEAR
jgi:hypothetical protein